MMKETYYTNGKHMFKNNEFDNAEWSAPYMVDKDEIKDTISKLRLEGRVIEDIKFVSHAYNLKVRSGAGVQYSQKLYAEMTKSAQKENLEYAEKGVAAYKKGTRFTAKKIVKISDDEYWAETPSGYVCLMKNGIEYVGH